MALDLEPGLAALGNPRLVRAIVEEMDGGAIPFERFMALALYHPEHGYYRTPGRIGAQGDFITSPAVSPIFGWVVGAWARWAWHELEEPSSFTVIEPGAGDGRLAASVLNWAEGRGDGFASALRYVAVEPNARGADERVTWTRPPLAPIEHGVVIANELFDAFPVRLFEATGRGPREVYVRWDGERFVEVQGPMVMVDDAPAEGRFEVNAHAYGAMRGLCSLVRKGGVLVFDYGYLQEELWAPWRTNGTLMTYYRHTAPEDPYIHVGEQDITAHVNMSELASAAEEEGFQVFGPRSQGEFLYAAGIARVVNAARGDMAEYFARRRAVERLTDSANFGRIRVLAATKGMDATPPGFGDPA